MVLAPNKLETLTSKIVRGLDENPKTRTNTHFPPSDWSQNLRMHHPLDNGQKLPPSNPFAGYDQKPSNPFEDQKLFSPFDLNLQHSMFETQPSRPVSAMPQTPGQVPGMGMFQMNNAFPPLLYANNVSNFNVSNWLNNFGSGAPGLPSTLSQRSFGAATASQVSLISHNTMLNSTRAESNANLERSDLVELFNILEEFNIKEVEFGKKFFDLIDRSLNRMDKESGKEVAEALLKTLIRVDYNNLIGDNTVMKPRLDLYHELVKLFYKLSKMYNTNLNLMEDVDKQRVLHCLLISLRHNFDESLLQVMNIIVFRSPGCQRLLCLRNNPSQPHLDSIITLKCLCSNLPKFQVRQKARAIHAFVNLFLMLLTCRRNSEELQIQTPLELVEVFTMESGRHVMLLLKESIQIIVTNNQQPRQQQINNVEIFESTVRHLCRLIFVLSEMDAIVNRLVDLEIIEQMTFWVNKLNHLSRTGYEARFYTVRTIANLSSCTEKLRNRDLTDAVVFILNCINQVYAYTADQITKLRIQAPETIVRLGVGFLFNVTRYNVRAQELLSRGGQYMEFLIKLGGGCTDFLQQPNLDRSRIKILIDIVEFTIETLCHLTNPSNPCWQMALQYLVTNPGVLFFTNFSLFQTDKVKIRLQVVNVILTMWKRAMSHGLFPPPIQTSDQFDITSGLLGFFTQRILEVGRDGQTEQERRYLESALTLSQEVIQQLIENQSIYAQFIEQKLCEKNEVVRPFQMLNHLMPTSACLMLKFLCSCCKLEQLRQLWSTEKDYQGNLVNQLILQQFRLSNDQNIATLSSLIYQQMFTSEYTMAEVFAGANF